MFQLDQGEPIIHDDEDRHYGSLFHRAILNGRQIAEASVSLPDRTSGKRWFALDGEDGLDAVLDATLAEVAAACSSVHLGFLSFAWVPDEPRFTSLLSTGESGGLNHLRIGLGLSARHWANSYSIAEYLDLLRVSLEKASIDSSALLIRDRLGDFPLDKVEVLDPAFDEVGFLLLPLSFDKGNICVKDHLDEWEERLAPVLQTVEDQLTTRRQPDSLVTYFEFPEEVRAPCEQYLAYFAQFLKDIGLETTTQLQQRPRGSLFTITPKDGFEALQKVREALDIYLAIPEVGSLPDIGSHSDLAIQQLTSTVNHLQSQLALANAQIQMKDAALLMKDATIHSLAAALPSRKAPHLLSSPPGSSANEASILGGTVVLTELQGRGFRVNIPELWRRLRRRLGANDPDVPEADKPRD